MDSYSLNAIDEIQWGIFLHTYASIESRREIEDGVVTIAVNNGGDADGLLTVTTSGADEFVTYNVYVAKIRRESAGLREVGHEGRVAWCGMAQAFIDSFGQERTPANIAKCLTDVREVFGVEGPTAPDELEAADDE